MLCIAEAGDAPADRQAGGGLLALPPEGLQGARHRLRKRGDGAALRRRAALLRAACGVGRRFPDERTCVRARPPRAALEHRHLLGCLLHLARDAPRPPGGVGRLAGGQFRGVLRALQCAPNLGRIHHREAGTEVADRNLVGQAFSEGNGGIRVKRAALADPHEFAQRPFEGNPARGVPRLQGLCCQPHEASAYPEDLVQEQG
mmetsp:Transcript_7211/g.20486  ORF Transcript_7211/g.20486 Transcript_7211/m.20486 type:complete len:202 (+) Transcript_7211:880-1485(+)